jgi:hypothetical protein
MKALKSFFYQFITRKITYFLKPRKTSWKWYGSDESVKIYDIYTKPTDAKKLDKIISQERKAFIDEVAKKVNQEYKENLKLLGGKK